MLRKLAAAAVVTAVSLGAVADAGVQGRTGPSRATDGGYLQCRLVEHRGDGILRGGCDV